MAFTSPLDALREKNKDGKLDKLIKATERTSGGKRGNFQEEDTYYPETDKNGNAAVIIRFLPGLETEEEPLYVETLGHRFKGVNQKYYNENCPTGVGKPCPSCDSNKLIVNRFGGDFDTLPENVKKLIRSRSRTHTFRSNILIINDPVHPELNGQVKKFKYGKKVLEKILAKAKPAFETDPVINIFDYKGGCNFKLIIKKVDGFANYNDSEFESPTDMPDDLIAYIKPKQFPLLQYASESQYKDYMTLRTILTAYVGYQDLAPVDGAIDQSQGGMQGMPGGMQGMQGMPGMGGMTMPGGTPMPQMPGMAGMTSPGMAGGMQMPGMPGITAPAPGMPGMTMPGAGTFPVDPATGLPMPTNPPAGATGFPSVPQTNQQPQTIPDLSAISPPAGTGLGEPVVSPPEGTPFGSAGNAAVPDEIPAASSSEMDYFRNLATGGTGA